MNIKIYILRDELQSMLESIVPMTVNLDPDNERSERWIRLDRVAFVVHLRFLSCFRCFSSLKYRVG